MMVHPKRLPSSKLTNRHRKSNVFPGIIYHKNGGFSIATLVYRSVTHAKVHALRGTQKVAARFKTFGKTERAMGLEILAHTHAQHLAPVDIAIFDALTFYGCNSYCIVLRWVKHEITIVSKLRLILILQNPVGETVKPSKNIDHSKVIYFSPKFQTPIICVFEKIALNGVPFPFGCTSWI